MNEFKIGDKVKLRDDLEVRRRYGKLEFLSGMRNLEGKELTIDDEIINIRDAIVEDESNKKIRDLAIVDFLLSTGVRVSE